MEEVRVRQADLQQSLYDVTNGAVIWKSDLLCRADEIPQTETTPQPFTLTVSSLLRPTSMWPRSKRMGGCMWMLERRRGENMHVYRKELQPAADAAGVSHVISR